jgi:hypothetical protein
MPTAKVQHACAADCNPTQLPAHTRATRPPLHNKPPNQDTPQARHLRLHFQFIKPVPTTPAAMAAVVADAISTVCRSPIGTYCTSTSQPQRTCQSISPPHSSRNTRAACRAAFFICMCCMRMHAAHECCRAQALQPARIISR